MKKNRYEKPVLKDLNVVGKGVSSCNPLGTTASACNTSGVSAFATCSVGGTPS